MSAFDAFRQSVTIRRRTAGEYVDGRWIEGAETVLTIKASVQPAKDSDMQMLPEGRRFMSSFRLYTDTELRSSEEHGANCDIAALPFGDHEIVAVMPWGNGIIPHFKAIAQRVQPQ